MIHSKIASVAWQSKASAFRHDEKSSAGTSNLQLERKSLDAKSDKQDQVIEVIGIGFNSRDAKAKAPPSLTVVEVYEREVPPAIAKLLNPEIIVRGGPVPPETAIIKPPRREWSFDSPNSMDGHQASVSNQNEWKAVTSGATHGTPVSSESTAVSMKRSSDSGSHSDTKEDIRDDIRASVREIDSVFKYKKPKLTEDGNFKPLSSPSSSFSAPSPVEIPTMIAKRPKVKWTKDEEKLLMKGYEEGLGWQAITRKYLQKRNRSGCYLHWQSMQAKTLSPRQDWTPDDNDKLAEAIKARSKEAREFWSKIAKDIGKGRTWKEVEIQRAHLIVKKEKGKEKKKCRL